MKTLPAQRHPGGFVSVLLVVVMSTVLLAMMVASYKHATNSQSFQASVQLRVDYGEKEEAISQIDRRDNAQPGDAGDAGAIECQRHQPQPPALEDDLQ
jgi:hypothetical protein